MNAAYVILHPLALAVDRSPEKKRPEREARAAFLDFRKETPTEQRTLASSVETHLRRSEQAPFTYKFGCFPVRWPALSGFTDPGRHMSVGTTASTVAQIVLSEGAAQ